MLDPLDPGAGGWTPMMYAAKNGHVEIVRSGGAAETLVPKNGKSLIVRDYLVD